MAYYQDSDFSSDAQQAPSVRYMRVSVIRSQNRFPSYASLAGCVQELVFVGIPDQASTAASCTLLTDMI